MDITQRPLVSNAEIQQLLRSAASSHQNHMLSNQFAAAGEHPSETIGAGLDFADRQPYARGDDPRFIDWRASARSSTTLVKRFHTEISAPSCVVIDRRHSMRFGTQVRLKATQAVRTGIHYGAQLLHAGQQLACLLLDEQLHWQAASNSVSTFHKTAHYAARACPPNQIKTNTFHWAKIADYLNTKLTQGSRLIIISDFISEPKSQAADQKALRYLSQYFNLSLVCISDVAEHQLKHSAIRLMNDKRSLPLGNIAQFNQALDAHQSQHKDSLFSLNCQSQFIQSHDELTMLKPA